jgi:hypothetical protein
MKIVVLYCTLAICVAAATLSGCGGSQPPMGAPSATSESGDSLPYHKPFYYTGAKQSFKVPAGVTKIDIVGRGAAGGSRYEGSPYGGRGGRVHAVIPVTPGEQLAVFVGGTPSGSSMNGGFNGGGYGGGLYNCCAGIGGGGASDVRQGGDALPKRIFVAGGGGGRGGGNGGASGGAGGRIGGSGGQAGFCGGSGGTGGTQTSGGLGGLGGALAADFPDGVHGIQPGGIGTRGMRGDGGIGGSPGKGSFSTDGIGGGGGGGGFFGGGGGGGGAGGGNYGYCLGYGGGGGGGSSYVEPSAISFKMWSGWKNATGNGLVVISWQ